MSSTGSSSASKSYPRMAYCSSVAMRAAMLRERWNTAHRVSRKRAADLYSVCARWAVIRQSVRETTNEVARVDWRELFICIGH